MKALSLTAPRKMEITDLQPPVPTAGKVLVRVDAVGLCGTDFHIYEGHANYNFDSKGQVIPLDKVHQVLGHEFCGTVVEPGPEVNDLKPGDRVVVDQGTNCHSRREPELCEYCKTGNSHQCAGYTEHGITGIQGALAELIAVPAVNCVKIESDLKPVEAALIEPLGCVIHACEMSFNAPARYQIRSDNPIRNILICGAGPAGLLFTQYIRNVIGYDGNIFLTEPNEKRRALAGNYGATVIDPISENLTEAVLDLTNGEKIHFLIESAGVASLFEQIPGLLRKQGTVLLYGHGHHGVDLGVINRIQFIEATLIAPTGASGGFEADGRPTTYCRSLDHLSNGRINVSRIITNQYPSLDKVPEAFAVDRFDSDYIKGVYVAAEELSL